MLLIDLCRFPIFSLQNFNQGYQGHLINANLRGFADIDEKLAALEKKYNRKHSFSFAMHMMKGYLSLLYDEYDTAKLYVEKNSVKTMIGFLGQFFTHVEYFFSFAVDTALIMNKLEPEDGKFSSNICNMFYNTNK